MMDKRFCLSMGLACIVCCLVCLVSVSAWAVPGVINYQGKLTNTSDCVLTGNYEVQFLLYDVATGGTPLWDEVQSTNVDDGLFTVHLGAVVSFPIGLFESDSLYLETMMLNPDSGLWETLSPRQRMTSTAYAIKADHAATAGDADTVDGKHASDLIVPETDPTVPANLKDGVSWSEVANIPADIADGDDVGVTTEQDPKVGSTTANSIPKWSEVTGKLVDSSSVFEDASGNVGISKTSPAFKLDVNGTINATEIFKNGVPFSGLSQWNNVTGGINYAGGNVGIGETSLNAKLHISGANSTTSVVDDFESSGILTGWTIVTNSNEITEVTTGHPIPFGNIMAKLRTAVEGKNEMYYEFILPSTPTPHTLIWMYSAGHDDATSGDYRFRLTDTSNNVLCDTGWRWMPLSHSRPTPWKWERESFDVTNWAGQRVRFWVQIQDTWWTPSAADMYVDEIKLKSGQDALIVSSGSVGIGTTSPSYKLHVAGDAMADHWYTSSDSRLKENIILLTDAIDKVSALRGIYFNLKAESPSNRQVGVIAQEVEAVLPEVVSTDAEGYKSVDYSRLTPLLIEATKAQQAQIEGQQAQIEVLEAQNEALKALVCQDHPEAQICQ